MAARRSMGVHAMIECAQAEARAVAEQLIPTPRLRIVDRAVPVPGHPEITVRIPVLQRKFLLRHDGCAWIDVPAGMKPACMENPMSVQETSRRDKVKTARKQRRKQHA
jgi:hypothetical protein